MLPAGVEAPETGTNVETNTLDGASDLAESDVIISDDDDDCTDANDGDARKDFNELNIKKILDSIPEPRSLHPEAHQ